jgi:biopolymer transport protein TolR
MAFSLSNGRTQSGLAEINVTPLVDVVLVLLVIFMITAPVIESGITVTVPHTRNTRALVKARLVVTVDQGGNVYLGSRRVNLHKLPALIAQKLRHSAQHSVYVRADERVSWGMLALVMDQIKRSVPKVRLVTQPYNHRAS